MEFTPDVLASPVRVASVPHGHVYVRHLADPSETDGIVRLADPKPVNAPPGAPWWPHGMLDAAWVRDHADEFDVFHVHFGFDSVEPDELARIVWALQDCDKPLVYTVHDLRNPHQADRERHDAALDVLVPAATELITLTRGAGDEIQRRWGREATVVGHPHVVGAHELHRVRADNARPLVGIHLKSLRANLHPLPVLHCLVDGVSRRGVDLVIDVHSDVMDVHARNHDPQVAELLREVSRKPGVDVHVHDYYSDAELWNYLAGLDLSVLPYRFGTHSGWLEACFDLGTKVLAPHVGYYHEQHDGVFGYRLSNDDMPDQEDIAVALDDFQSSGPWRANALDRLTQRQQIAATHRHLYDRALARVQA